MTAAEKLQDYEDARRLLLADCEFRPHDSMTSMVRALLGQRNRARVRGKDWREQVLAAGQADEDAANEVVRLPIACVFCGGSRLLSSGHGFRPCQECSPHGIAQSAGRGQ